MASTDAESGTLRRGDVRPTGPFDWRWPEGEEHFASGWDYTVQWSGRTVRVRHGLGERMVYGRTRMHSVTWVNGQPAVEGVAADDYAQSRSLLSILKRPDKHHIRVRADVPPDYEAATIVVHNDEIIAPRSPASLAVKLVEDDLDAWANHALRRVTGSGNSAPQDVPQPLLVPSPTQPVAEPRHRETGASTAAIVAVLLAYGETHTSEDPAERPSFTPNPEANALLLADPFAFLLAVICDQGIPAERAWQAPYELRRRLGSLDPATVAADLDAVRRAVKEPPALHRYVENMPRWIVAAATRVLRDYAGDAGRIWGDKPAAVELRRRLEAFTGIGQKKAAMAVEILERDLGVPIGAMEGSDIAYDVHVRRVFLRTGLAERDELDHMVAVAREAYPERPGAIDFPAWLVGRTWRHAGVPACSSCVLGEVCPKELQRAAGIVSA